MSDQNLASVSSIVHLVVGEADHQAVAILHRGDLFQMYVCSWYDHYHHHYLGG